MKYTLISLFLFLGYGFPETPDNSVAGLGREFVVNSTESEFRADPFVILVTGAEKEGLEALKGIEQSWSSASIPKAVEVFRFVEDRTLQTRLMKILEDKTGQRNFGVSFGDWSKWLWNQPPMYDDSYAFFKSELYRIIDPRFADYFRNTRGSRIRLDEIVWGGVIQDGIPPLRNPKMFEAEEAHYLKDGHLVFGIEINGEARAYPRRILAWHEMFVDTIQGKKLVGVYCTLCGTVILYFTENKGINHEIGTSGFLYRSNKLMYDKASSSLWNTFWGEPVVGNLAESEIRLERGAVVNTTWGEWKTRHPESKVLSLDTGFNRDYKEGAAYRQYFATDKLMFQVPFEDNRLKNKAEVFTIIEGDSLENSLALHLDFLTKNPLYQTEFNGRNVIVLTDRSGGVRAYELRGQQMESWDRGNLLVDETGISWVLSESRLSSSKGSLSRIGGQVAFWFGWVAANPNTILIK